MVDPSAPYRPLPSQADREKLIEQAKRVLAEAQAIAERLDRSFALLSAERPAKSTTGGSHARIGGNPR